MSNAKKENAPGHAPRTSLASLVILVPLILMTVGTTLASGASWQMKNRDTCNTGRADFTIAATRLNDQLFDVIAWQTPSPGSPGEGGFSTTQMTFFDGVGPGNSDIVAGGYHWPKGVQAMDRHTGAVKWFGNPWGGESIGTIAPAFSNNGHTMYVVNDATGNAQYPNGFPLMAFNPATGPSTFWHNGTDANPSLLGMGSPKIAPDGRIFMHSWVDRPHAGTDNGTAISKTWSAAAGTNCIYPEPALYTDGSQLKVIMSGGDGTIYCFDGSTGAVIWSKPCGIGGFFASTTIDPANGNIYVSGGSSNIYVVGLKKDGTLLWSTLTKQVFTYQGGVNNPQLAIGTGCLSQDGSTYYFQTNSSQGDGKLYAIKTSDGSLKWSYATQSTGWDSMSSTPIITQNGVVIVGNNAGCKFFAIKDDTTTGTLIDSIQVDSAGSARTSASLAPDGSLFIPLRVIWSTPNGSGTIPDFKVGNLFTCINLASGATTKLSPPPNQGAVALNHAVALSWTPIVDPSNQFDHYAVYRATAAFTSVSGKTPIASVTGLSTSGYTDNTALNGTHYYYAVTTISKGGGEITTVNSIGPCTPRDETDLQVVSISRTPYYPRYLPTYTYRSVTEPSGFGPYTFSAATGLGGGQTTDTQRWPRIDDTITYTATVRNRGTNNWTGTLSATWKVDGVTVSQPSKSITLTPGTTTTFTYANMWDNEMHDISFTMNVTDARPLNNTLSIDSKSVGFLTYADAGYIEKYRENTATSWPQAKNDDLFDWLNSHMTKLNEMFAAAGSRKRVHYDILQAIPDGSTDPTTDTTPFAIFPFRYHAADGDARGSGYYSRTEDIDYGLCHEMGHQLGLIDIYQFDLSSSANQVSGMGYSGFNCLMRTCAPFISEFSGLAMDSWEDDAHGYYGQFMYNIPQTVRLRVLGFDGNPLRGAVVKMYQACERPGIGRYITNQIKAQGTTDSNGIFTLPNVPIDQSLVPPIGTGDTLHDNPFGYLAVVGTNGVLHFRVEYNGGVDYCWLDVNETNIAYWHGQTVTATFDRQLGLGGAVQHYPPGDMAELNANDWAGWGEGSSAGNTYLVDDTSRKVVGSGSVKFVTDGGFDTYARYPRTFTAQWDLRTATTLNFRVYSINPNGSFQSGSPWIRLKDANGNYYQYQYYVNGGIIDLLNESANQWKSYSIPLNASDTVQTGWRRTSLGTPDLSNINSIEFHADTWGGGFNYWLDGVCFTFTGPAVSLIKDTKLTADNGRSGLLGARVSAAWPNVFYVETLDRSSGIRVEKTGHGLHAGDIADVFGFIKTTADGERAIDASWASFTGSTCTVLPLLMTNGTLGGAGFGYNPVTRVGQQGVVNGHGVNNIGLFVKAWGTVVDRDTSPVPTWYKIDDGSGAIIKVIVVSGATVPAKTTFVTVTGINSCYKVGSSLYPQILAK